MSYLTPLSRAVRTCVDPALLPQHATRCSLPIETESIVQFENETADQGGPHTAHLDGLSKTPAAAEKRTRARKEVGRDAQGRARRQPTQVTGSMVAAVMPETPNEPKKDEHGGDLFSRIYSSRNRFIRFVCYLAVLIAVCLLVGLSAGGFQVKGLQGASLSRCKFNPADPPYEYPHQPAATDVPPYSTLFEEVCIQGGTEPTHREFISAPRSFDTYICPCCAAKLFSGASKYSAAISGWPSFYAPFSSSSIGYSRDLLQAVSTEVHCNSCGAHLGHVFADGPGPTGLRYCINGVCLRKQIDNSTDAGSVYLSNPLVFPDFVAMLVGLIGLGFSIAACMAVQKDVRRCVLAPHRQRAEQSSCCAAPVRV